MTWTLFPDVLATVHLSWIVGHADVPALDTDALADSGITGALGLCAVSVCQFIGMVCCTDLFNTSLNVLSPLLPTTPLLLIIPRHLLQGERLI